MSRIAVATAALFTFGLTLGCKNAEKAAGPARVPASSADYNEVEKDGRIYVLGSTDSLDKFKSTGEMPSPLTVTLIGAGPNNETVIIESEKDPALEVRLKKEFLSRLGTGK